MDKQHAREKKCYFYRFASYTSIAIKETTAVHNPRSEFAQHGPIYDPERRSHHCGFILFLVSGDCDFHVVHSRNSFVALGRTNNTRYWYHHHNDTLSPSIGKQQRFTTTVFLEPYKQCRTDAINDNDTSAATSSFNIFSIITTRRKSQS
jgi:hypothetical protein